MNHWKKTISIATASAFIFLGIVGAGSMGTISAHAWDVPPTITDVAAVPSSGTLTPGMDLEVYITAANQENGMTLYGPCTINNVDVSSSFQDETDGLYELDYTVGANDTNRAAGDVPILCTLQNEAGSTTVSAFTDGNTVAIDTTATGTSTGTTTGTGGGNGGGNNGGNGGGNGGTTEGAPSITAVASVPSSGTLGVGDDLQVYLTAANQEDDLTLGGTCTINNVAVSPLQNETDGLYELDYTVGANDTNRTAGEIPIDCELKNPSGGATVVEAFTDGNTVAINTSGTGVGTTTGTTTGTSGGNGGGTTGGTGTSSSTTPSITAVAAVPSSGTLDPGMDLQVYLTAANQEDDLTLGSTCTINNVSVSPLQNETDGLYELDYTVGANDMSQTAGNVPIDCVLQNASGASTTVTTFTDNNTVAINAGAFGTTTGTTTGTSGGNGGGTGTGTTTGTGGTTGGTGTTTGTISGTVTGSSTVPLSVTSIVPVQTAATADDSYGDGWSWTFNVTVPNNQHNLEMKFGDWTNTANSADTIPVAGNMEISSPEATSTSPEQITGSNIYSMPLSLTSATSSANGQQVQVTVQMKIPSTTVNGSYTTNYGIQSY